MVAPKHVWNMFLPDLSGMSSEQEMESFVYTYINIYRLEVQLPNVHKFLLQTTVFDNIYIYNHHHPKEVSPFFFVNGGMPTSMGISPEPCSTSVYS